MAAISVRESGGDYTSLEAAVENASTVNGDVITISGTWSARENTRIAVADALTIQATGDSKHYGRPWQTGDTHYQHRSTSSTSNDHSFTITDTGSVTFDGLDIQHAGTGVSNEIFRNSVSNTFLAKNCVLGFASRTDQQDIYYNEQVANVTFENCMFYNAYRAVVDLYIAENGSVVNINSCVAYDCGNSSAASSRSGIVGVFGQIGTLTVNLFNSILHVNTGVPVTTDGSITLNAHTVISNAVNLFDITYTNINTNTNNVTSATITDSTAASAYILNNITTSPYDLRITDHANNLAQDNHTNGTGTGTGLSVPATDILGTSRPQNTNYDIGAFEIVAGGGPITGTSSHQASTSTQTATGLRIVTGSSSNTALTATQTSSGVRNITGVMSVSASDATQTSIGHRVILGTLAHQASNSEQNSTGQRVVTSSGYHQSDTSTNAATGKRIITGVSSAQANTSTHSSAGAIEGAISGSASHQASTSTHSAVGLRLVTGSASHQVSTATQDSIGSVGNVISGTGSHAANDATHSAVGLRIVGGTATHQASTATHSASGAAQGTITGTSSHQASTSTHVAAALRVITGTGAHQATYATQAATDIPLVQLPPGNRGIDDITQDRAIVNITHKYGVSDITNSYDILKLA